MIAQPLDPQYALMMGILSNIDTIDHIPLHIRSPRTDPTRITITLAPTVPTSLLLPPNPIKNTTLTPTGIALLFLNLRASLTKLELRVGDFFLAAGDGLGQR